MEYYLEDKIFIDKKDEYRLLIREHPDDDDSLIERFDKKLGRWVEDVDMLGIYVGEIDVSPITEEEAYRFIKEVYKIEYKD